MRRLLELAVICLLVAPCAVAAAPPDSVSIILNSGTVQSIPSLIPGVANNFIGGPLSVTMSWNALNPGRSAVTLYGYFDSATSALVHTTPGNTVDIPSGAVKVRINNAGGYLPFSNLVPFTGTASGVTLVTISITGQNKNGGSNTSTFQLQIDLSLTNVNGQNMTQLPPDTYTGTLHIQAQATP